DAATPSPVPTGWPTCWLLEPPPSPPPRDDGEPSAAGDVRGHQYQRLGARLAPPGDPRRQQQSRGRYDPVRHPRIRLELRPSLGHLDDQAVHDAPAAHRAGSHRWLLAESQPTIDLDYGESDRRDLHTDLHGPRHLPT